MNEYKVSIIVSIYNSACYLRKGLESVRKQTWKNIEVILVNDGSTDNSGVICDEYATIDERFIPIHKSNTGVCDSRNQGLSIATGRYVCFMDGDDWLCYDYIEYMMSLLSKTDTHMAFSDQLFTTRDQSQSTDKSIEVWNAEKTISRLIYPYMTLGPWNKIYSMDVIRKHRIEFPSHWFGETLHFASNVAYYSGKIGVGHRKVYNYRVNNANSGTAQYNIEYRLLSLDNCINLRNAVFYRYPSVRDAVEWHIYSAYFVLIMNIIACDQKLEYKKEYTEARLYMRQHFFDVLIHSDINLRQRVKLIAELVCPELLAIMTIHYRKWRLSKDLALDYS